MASNSKGWGAEGATSSPVMTPIGATPTAAASPIPDSGCVGVKDGKSRASTSYRSAWVYFRRSPECRIAKLVATD